MKRIIIILTIVALLISFIGCTKNTENFDQPAQFYYKWASTEDALFGAETREIKSYSDDLLAVANFYFTGPDSDAYVNVFPDGLHALSLEVQENKLMLLLNDELSTLSGLELSIACACMSMTLLELTGCTEIVIKAESKLLDGKASISMKLDDLYLLDTLITVN